MNSKQGILYDGVYFNTTGEEGESLKDNLIVALTQNNIIHEMFCRYKTLSPSQCMLKYAGFCTNVLGEKFRPTPPITSIRRGITTLTDEGLLVKTEKKVTGIYGRPEMVWEINN